MIQTDNYFPPFLHSTARATGEKNSIQNFQCSGIDKEQAFKGI